MFYHHKKAKS